MLFETTVDIRIKAWNELPLCEGFEPIMQGGEKDSKATFLCEELC